MEVPVTVKIKVCLQAYSKSFMGRYEGGMKRISLYFLVKSKYSKKMFFFNFITCIAIVMAWISVVLFFPAVVMSFFAD